MDEELTELWNEYKEERKQKRASNREASLRLLQGAGYSPTVKNDGAHLVMTVDGVRFDFWPGTGLWVEDGNHKQQLRGVRRLLRRLRAVSSNGRRIKE
jgi:hypothetical protein